MKNKDIKNQKKENQVLFKANQFKIDKDHNKVPSLMSNPMSMLKTIPHSQHYDFNLIN